jgi:tight adherence protein C
MTLIEQFGLPLASTALAAAVAILGWAFITVVTFPREKLDRRLDSFETRRRQTVRANNTIYRWFEPVVHEIANRLRRSASQRVERLRGSLLVAVEPLRWDAAEFLATKCIEGFVLGGLVFGAIAMLGKPVVGVILGSGLIATFPLLYTKTMADRAKNRMRRMRIRLPFSVDLVALMMEAGGSFQESLQTVVDENRDHPVGEEFGEVLRQIALGRTRADALRAMQTRLNDDDISEMVFAINKGEELGTPLSAILRDQADQMREKRSQWGEKAAAEAEVKLVFPGMVVMVACLIVILGPILLPALLPLL